MLVVKNLPANAGDPGSIPLSGRSPGVGNGNPLQYSCLENSMGRGAWWAAVHGVAKNQTHLSIHPPPCLLSSSGQHLYLVLLQNPFIGQMFSPWRSQGSSLLAFPGSFIYLKIFCNFLFCIGIGSPGGTVVKNQPATAGDTGDAGSIPESGRSPGEGNGNPLQYSCLGNPMGRGAWWATVHGVAESDRT